MKGNGQTTADEDLEILSLCKQGNIDSFETLVLRYQKRMLNIAYRIIHNYEDACEIVQDAFVSVYKNIGKFKGDSKFSTWLYSIVVNLSKNRLKQVRTQSAREPYSLDDPVMTRNGHMNGVHPSNEPSVLENLEKKNIRQKVQECINSLDMEFKETIILRDIQGFSYDEIGGILNIAEGTVKSRLFRAREAVKNCLKKFKGEL